MSTTIGLIIITAITAGLIWFAAYVRDHAFGGAFRKRTTSQHLDEYKTLTRFDM